MDGLSSDKKMILLPILSLLLIIEDVLLAANPLDGSYPENALLQINDDDEFMYTNTTNIIITEASTYNLDSSDLENPPEIKYQRFSINQTIYSGRISATDPYIDSQTPELVTAYVGSTALLPCFVNNLGQRSVSWVRHKDIHVLTVGQFTFTNDGRFLSHHEDGTNEWVLRLRTPVMQDTGLYECQINTKPVISKLIQLSVVEPKTILSGASELYVKYGSTLTLTCLVTNTEDIPKYLIWHHNQKVVNYETIYAKINTTIFDNQTISVLKVKSVRQSDSGTYTCAPSNAKENSAFVHVIAGEHPAAMQTNIGLPLQEMWIFLLILSVGISTIVS